MQKNLPQKWHNVTHKTSKQSKRHSKASSRWLRALCLDRSAYSLPTVVEVAAVAGVALHAQVTGRPRWCRMTWHLGGHKLFDSLFTLCRLLAPNCNYTTYRRGSNTHTHTEDEFTLFLWTESETCFLHRAQMQSHWSDSHSDQHTEAWGPAVQYNNIYYTLKEVILD